MDTTLGGFQESISKLLTDAFAQFKLYILGPLFGAIQQFFVPDVFWASPYTWVGIFWLANLFLGTFLALLGKTWTPRKALMSVVKLLVWCGCLLMATGVIHTGVQGGWVVAGILQGAALFTECAYLARNLGRIATLSGNPRQGEILSMAGDTMEEFLDSRVRTHTVIEVKTTEVKTVQPSQNEEIH